MNKTTTAILFTGGLDSTYMAYKILDETKDDIVLLSYNILNNPNQTNMENIAKKELFSLFKAQYPGRIEYNDKLVSVDLANGNYQYDHVIPQPMLWLSFSSMFMRDVDRLLVSYVSQDCALSYIEDLRQLWKSLELFKDRHVKLEFPLIKMPKQEIWENLPFKYKEHVSFCENGKMVSDGVYVPCGSCASCIKHYNATGGGPPKLSDNKLNDIKKIEIVNSIDIIEKDIIEKEKSYDNEIIEKYKKRIYINNMSRYLSTDDNDEIYLYILWNIINIVKNSDLISKNTNQTFNTISDGSGGVDMKNYVESNAYIHEIIPDADILKVFHSKIDEILKNLTYQDVQEKELEDIKYEFLNSYHSTKWGTGNRIPKYKEARRFE